MRAFFSIKIWTETHRLAKMVAADQGETLVHLLHRLVLAEAEKLGINNIKRAAGDQ